MDKCWKVTIELDVNAHGVDFDAWERSIGRAGRIVKDQVMIRRQDGLVVIEMLCEAQEGIYGHLKALMDSRTAMRRAFRSMKFAIGWETVLKSVKVERPTVADLARITNGKDPE